MPVTVNLSVHKEIVEEVAKFDIETFGIADIMRRRADNHAQSMIRELDSAFLRRRPPPGRPSHLLLDVTKIEEIMESMIPDLGNHEE